MDQALKKEEIPAGGIADFVMTDEQIEQLEAEELKEQFGTNGIAQFSDVGKKMANFGRYGDDTVAHVETGELIVPRALIEKNPELKESIFKHLKELGVEDPERYVVGESKNSVNPTTGLPEFFFKKLFRSISKVAKGVGKALKKAAPLIIPMAINYFAPGLGTVMSGALGAGIGTLVQGGSAKDAFRSAVLGGATGAVTAGLSGKGNFMENIATDIGTGTSSVKAAFQGNFEPLQGTAQPNIRDLFSEETSVSGDTRTLYDGTKVENMYPDAGNYSVENIDSNNLLDKRLSPVKTRFDSSASPEAYGFKTGDGAYNTEKLNKLMKNINEQRKLLNEGIPITDEALDAMSFPTPKPSDLMQQQPTMFEKVKNFMMPSDVSYVDILKEQGIDLKNVTEAQIKVAKQMAADQSPDFLRKYGPSLALATAAGAAGGFFDAPEEEELEPVRTGLDVYKEDPDKYGVRDLAVSGSTGDTTSPTSYGFEYNPYLFSKTPFQTAAEGGEIFPRRVGGIMPDEGIPNKDSVRAMLMPGEFVMTTDAVKGLGGGDMNKGINNMYSVMRNLEQRGKAMA